MKPNTHHQQESRKKRARKNEKAIHLYLSSETRGVLRTLQSARKKSGVESSYAAVIRDALFAYGGKPLQEELSREAIRHGVKNLATEYAKYEDAAKYAEQILNHIHDDSIKNPKHADKNFPDLDEKVNSRTKAMLEMALEMMMDYEPRMIDILRAHFGSEDLEPWYRA